MISRVAKGGLDHCGYENRCMVRGTELFKVHLIPVLPSHWVQCQNALVLIFRRSLLW